MLVITVPLRLNFDEETSEFVTDGVKLELEHSLVSLSKWEFNFEKPFLSTGEKTIEETMFYIRECMLLTKDVPSEVFSNLTKENFEEIQNYINNKKSSTWFNDSNKGGASRQTITSAVIYGMMVSLRIPFETQYWHLNELLTLIRVCNEQNKPPKKMSREAAARQQAEINARRRAEMGTRG